MTEQDDTPQITVHYDMEAIVKLSRLQAVAALDENFGYRHGRYGMAAYGWMCKGCRKLKGHPHADGCPVGLYEKGKDGAFI